MPLIKAVRWLSKWLVRLGVIAASIAITIYLVRAFDSRRLPDLEPWHTVRLQHEFRARGYPDGISFDDYMALEESLFRELNDKIVRDTPEHPRDRFNRYVRGSASFPDGPDGNWNRSREITTANPVGGVLLLHGLTDSPYSTRALAGLFARHGLYVLVVRLPGHGTTPGSLIDARWQDWAAVTVMGVERVRARIGSERPLYIAGYSTGGALALKYTVDALHDDSLEQPDRLFLFSPAVGITSFATVAGWHRLLTGIDYFEKFAWNSILPEYDPYKYNSFAKMGGHQVYVLANVVQADLNRLDADGRMDELPPMIAFYSLVDSTVLTPPLTSKVFDRLHDEESHLVLFDINRLGAIGDFLKARNQWLVEELLARNDLGFTFTLVTNLNEGSLEVIARTRTPGSLGESVESTGLSWEGGLFSMSHVAIPFPPDDPWYGSETKPGGISLGTMTPRGERNVLTISLDQLMRLRYNPFFGYQQQKIIEFCPVCAGTMSPAATGQHSPTDSE